MLCIGLHWIVCVLHWRTEYEQTIDRHTKSLCTLSIQFQSNSRRNITLGNFRRYPPLTVPFGLQLKYRKMMNKLYVFSAIFALVLATSNALEFKDCGKNICRIFQFWIKHSVPSTRPILKVLLFDTQFMLMLETIYLSSHFEHEHPSIHQISLLKLLLAVIYDWNASN